MKFNIMATHCTQDNTDHLMALDATKVKKELEVQRDLEPNFSTLCNSTSGARLHLKETERGTISQNDSNKYWNGSSALNIKVEKVEPNEKEHYNISDTIQYSCVPSMCADICTPDGGELSSLETVSRERASLKVDADGYRINNTRDTCRSVVSSVKIEQEHFPKEYDSSELDRTKVSLNPSCRTNQKFPWHTEQRNVLNDFRDAQKNQPVLSDIENKENVTSGNHFGTDLQGVQIDWEDVNIKREQYDEAGEAVDHICPQRITEEEFACCLQTDKYSRHSDHKEMKEFTTYCIEIKEEEENKKEEVMKKKIDGPEIEDCSERISDEQTSHERPIEEIPHLADDQYKNKKLTAYHIKVENGEGEGGEEKEEEKMEETYMDKKHSSSYGNDYECSHLQKEFQSVTHICDSHRGKELLKCGACSKVVGQQENHNEHMKVYSPENCSTSKEMVNPLTNSGNLNEYIKPGSSAFIEESTSHRANDSHSCEDTESANSLKATDKKCKKFVLELSSENVGTHGFNSAHKRQYHCSECTKSFTFKSSLQAHMKIHSNSQCRRYRCHKCFESFKSKSYLQTHVKKVHPVKIPCQFCSESFKSITDLHYHINTQCEKKNYKCSYCPECLDFDTALQAHMKTHEDRQRLQSKLRNHVKTHNKQTYQCTLCIEDFSSQCSLQLHMTSHKRNIICQICTRRFDSLYALQNHLKIQHDKQTHKCTSCHQAFRCKTSLQSHMETHKETRDTLSHKCTSCPQAFSCKNSLQSHMKTHKETHDKLDHMCTSSPQAFNCKNSLQSHMKTHKETHDKLDHKCNSSPQAFNCKNSLQSHMETHKETCDKLSHNCNFSPQAFSCKNSLQSHMKTHKETDDNLSHKCTSCPQAFSCKNSLQSHMETHKETCDKLSYKCTSCTQAFSCKKSLQSHMKTHPVINVICQICNKSFKTMCWFENHTKIHIHLMKTRKAKDHKCVHCQKTFSLKCSLTSHMKIHQANSHICSFCAQGFRFKNSLQLHMKTHQTKIICQICCKSFKKMSWFKSHMKIHNKPNYSVYPQIGSCKASLQSPMKTYQVHFICHVCTKSFASVEALRSHIKTHKAKDHKCVHCQKTFSQKGSLATHMRIHQNKSGHILCKRCPKKFQSNCDLNDHMKTHHKEDYHTCSYCPELFEFKSNLQAHMKTHLAELT